MLSGRLQQEILLILLALGFTMLHAQSGKKTERIDLTKGVLIELVPHTGFMGSSGIFGIKMNMNYSALAFELAAEQVIGKTANMYPVSVNALINLTTRGNLIPYGIVGPVLYITVPTNTVGDETVTTAGLNFGGGLRYYFSTGFGIRLEAKQYFTTVNSNKENLEEILIFQEICIGVNFILN